MRTTSFIALSVLSVACGPNNTYYTGTATVQLAPIEPGVGINMDAHVEMGTYAEVVRMIEYHNGTQTLEILGGDIDTNHCANLQETAGLLSFHFFRSTGETTWIDFGVTAPEVRDSNPASNIEFNGSYTQEFDLDIRCGDVGPIRHSTSITWDIDEDSAVVTDRLGGSYGLL